MDPMQSIIKMCLAVEQSGNSHLKNEVSKSLNRMITEQNEIISVQSYNKLFIEETKRKMAEK